MDERYSHCLSCNFLNALYENYMNFSIALYREMAMGLLTVLGALVLIWISWMVFAGIADDNLGERLKKSIRVFMALPLVVALLQSGPITDTDSIPIVHQWYIMPLEQGAGELGLYIIEIANTLGETSSLKDIIQAKIDANGSNPPAMFVVEVEGEKITNNYALLAYGIERSVWHIIQLAISFMGESIKATFAGLLLALPYLFVLGIFAAFMTEAMFSFLSMSSFLPGTLYCSIFPSLRPIAIASLRINFGAFLTIMFAAGAMGFSIAVVDKLGKQYAYNEEMRNGKAEELDNARKERTRWCGREGGNVSVGPRDKEKCQHWIEEQNRLYAELEAMLKAAQLSDEYMILLLMGFVSLLLHLKSKTLASNLSGAQDGAGPAAATVAGMKAAALGAMMYGGRSAFGQEGVMSQAMGLPMSGQQGGQPMGIREGLRTGGLAGGLRSMMQNARSGSGVGGAMTPDDYANQASAGGPAMSGGGGGGTMRFDTSQLQQLTKAITDGIRGSTDTDHLDREGN